MSDKLPDSHRESEPVPVVIKSGKDPEPVPVTVETARGSVPPAVWNGLIGAFVTITIAYLQLRQIEATNEANKSAREAAEIVVKTSEIAKASGQFRDHKIDNIEKIGVENHAMLNSATLANLENIEKTTYTLSQMKPEREDWKQQAAAAKQKVNEHKVVMKALEAKINKDKIAAENRKEKRDTEQKE